MRTIPGFENISYFITAFLLLGSPLSVFAQAQADPAETLSLEDIFNLEVVTASKKKEAALTAPGTIYVVTADEIQRQGWITLREVLASIPGVELQWNWNWLAGGQRGFAAPGNFSQSLLLLDGREIQNVSAWEAFITGAMAAHKIARVEVVQGPNSTLYGAAAMQGVINIITKTGEHGKDLASVSVTQGQVGTRQVGLDYRKSDGDYVLGASFTHYYSDQNWDKLADFAASTSRFSRHPTLGVDDDSVVDMDGFRYRGRENFINFERSNAFDLYAKAGDFYGGINYFRTANTGGIEEVTVDYLGKRADRETQIYFLGHKHQFSENVQSKVEFHLQEEHNQWHFRGPESIPAAEVPTSYEDYLGFAQINVYEDDYTAMRVRSQLDINTENFGSWMAGYELNHRDGVSHYTGNVNVLEALGSDLGVGSFYLSEPIEPRIDHGLFLQNSQQIWDSLKAIAGIRYTTSNYQGSISVDPRLSFIWQPAESSSLKLTYGEGFRAPALYESGILDDETEATPPLQMQMVDLNYSQQIKLGGSKITNTASLYWMNSSTNFVQEEDADEPGSYSLVPESDPFQVIGFEDQVKFDFGRFKGFLGGRYIAPEKSVLDGGSKTYIKDVPLMKAKVGVSYQLLSHLELSAFVDHWSSVDTEAPTADGTGTEVYTVPAWTVVSTNIGLNQFKWNSMVGRFNINIENLFDTPYYHANIRGGRPLQFLQAPRTIRAQLTINI